MANPDYFTLDEFRELPDMGNAAKYPESRILAAAAYITAIIEREVGTSFVPRSVTETYDGGGSLIVLRSPYVRALTSVTDTGVTVSDGVIAAGGVLRRGSSGYSATPWSVGVNNVSVTYTAGYSDTPPADIKEAAMAATRSRLIESSSTSGIDDRRTSLSNEMGTINFVVAGEGRPTGYPMVDEVIMGWKRKLDHFGFA